MGSIFSLPSQSRSSCTFTTFLAARQTPRLKLRPVMNVANVIALFCLANRARHRWGKSHRHSTARQSDQRRHLRVHEAHPLALKNYGYLRSIEMSDALVDLLYSAVRFTAITTTKGVPDPQWRFAYRFFGSRGIRSTNNRKEPAVTDFAWVAQCREMI